MFDNILLKSLIRQQSEPLRIEMTTKIPATVGCGLRVINNNIKRKGRISGLF